MNYTKLIQNLMNHRKMKTPMINVRIENIGAKLMKIKILHNNKIIIIVKHGINF
mgnify:CR=1 FL=1|jgi:hypothetical protein